MKVEILRMENVSLIKNGKYLLKDLSINIFQGEVVVAFGYSGSGIHEIGDILSGKTEIMSGVIRINENIIIKKKQFYPEQNGVFIIQNTNNLVPDLTIAENLFFGGNKFIFSVIVADKTQREQAVRVLKNFGINIDVRKKAKNLLYHEEMLIKMVKAYIKGAKLIIINDIVENAYLKNWDQFVNIIQILKKDGTAVLWLTQRPDYIQNLADRLIVLRNGRKVKTFFKNSYSLDKLMSIAADSQIENFINRSTEKSGECVLSIKQLSCKHLTDLSLSIRKRQITGIWANEPLALEDIHKVLCGEMESYSGEIMLSGKKYSPKSYAEAIKSGVNYFNQMWYERHCLFNMNVIDNLMLQNYWLQKPMMAFISPKWIKYMKAKWKQRHPEWSLDRWEDLSIDQQRILLFEKYLEQPGKVYLITEAFSRISYNLTSEITEILYKLIEKDKALVLLSMNYQDLSRVCEKIYIIKDGELKRELQYTDFKSIDISDFIS